MQVMACVAGRVRIELATRTAQAVTHCEPDGPALLIRAGVMARQVYLDTGSTLLVICSEPFDPASYITDREFLPP